MAMLVESIRPVIEHCPEACRKHFLPPILSALFEQLDRKASTEWERIEERNKSSSEDDDLTNEMKDESILRQLTMASVMLVVALLEPPRPSMFCDILRFDKQLTWCTNSPSTSPRSTNE